MNRLFYSGLKIGTKLFGRYRIRECLNSSEVSAVYLCEDKSEKLVVLKIANAADKVNDQARNIIEREIAVARKFHHKNLISPIEIHEDDEFVAFSMEYYPRGTLADYIEPEVGLESPEKAMTILTQILEGLAELHDQGIAHRDIKPENILLTGSTQARIADFGLAASTQGAHIPFQDCIVGTPDYLSPEYVLHGQMDERSDMYSFGVLAYQTLTGRFPHTGSCVLDTLSKRIKEDAVKPSTYNPKISSEMDKLILKCLSRAPEQRPTAKQCLRQLHQPVAVSMPVMIRPRRRQSLLEKWFGTSQAA